MQDAPKPKAGFILALKSARAALRGMDPATAADRAGAVYDAGVRRFTVPFFFRSFTVSFPEGVVVEAGKGEEKGATALILLHYLSGPEAPFVPDRWIAFHQIPGARNYRPVFEGSSARLLSAAFGSDGERFSAVCRTLGGEKVPPEPASFAFAFLPKVRLLLQLFPGDEEDGLPPGAGVLFNAAAPHFLSAEDLAHLGRWLCREVVKIGTRDSGSGERNAPLGSKG